MTVTRWARLVLLGGGGGRGCGCGRRRAGEKGFLQVGIVAFARKKREVQRLGWRRDRKLEIGNIVIDGLFVVLGIWILLFFF